MELTSYGLQMFGLGSHHHERGLGAGPIARNRQVGVTSQSLTVEARVSTEPLPCLILARNLIENKACCGRKRRRPTRHSWSAGRNIGNRLGLGHLRNGIAKNGWRSTFHACMHLSLGVYFVVHVYI